MKERNPKMEPLTTQPSAGEAPFDCRRAFEENTKAFYWNLRRSDLGYYTDSHVEYAFIGFCMANHVNHREIP